jgi:hypothetical protein
MLSFMFPRRKSNECPGGMHQRMDDAVSLKSFVPIAIGLTVDSRMTLATGRKRSPRASSVASYVPQR